MKLKVNKKYAIIGFAYLVFFYMFMYSDILITTSHGINLWDILFQGKIRDFYQLCYSDVNNAAYEIYNAALYDMFIYVIFAIWNFPLWVVRKLTAINIWNSALAMVWAKTLILVFTLLACKSLYRIGETLQLEEKSKRMSVVLFLTTPYLFSCIFVASQYDIIYLFFMLEALNFYLKNDMKRFVLLMMITLPIKPFGAFMFVPLILYKEKNVLKIVGYTILCFLPYMLMKVIMPSEGNPNVLVMFKSKFTIAGFEMYTFIFAICCFYIICYLLSDNGDAKAFNRTSIRLVFLAYAIFFIICGGNPYWYILIAPFQILLIVIDEKSSLVKCILEMISSVCVCASFVWQCPWVFGTDIVKSTYISKIFGLRENDTNNILDIIHKYIPSVYDMAEDRVAGVFFSLFVAGMIGFIYAEFFQKEEYLALRSKEITKTYIYIRLLIGLMICLIPIVAYVF